MLAAQTSCLLVLRDGSTLHASTIGGTNDDAGIGVAIASNGDYILGGGFRGSIEIAQENPSSQGDMDALLVRIGGASHQVSLVAGRGDDDNAAFAIESGKLVAIDPLNYEVKNEYDVRVRLTDAGWHFYREGTQPHRGERTRGPHQHHPRQPHCR